MVTVVLRQNGGEVSCRPDGNTGYKTYYGLSADTKPVQGAHNADVFYEMDTKAIFLFDQTNSVWLEQ